MDFSGAENKILEIERCDLVAEYMLHMYVALESITGSKHTIRYILCIDIIFNMNYAMKQRVNNIVYGH